MNYTNDHIPYSSDTLCGMSYLELRSLFNDADTLCLPVRFLESVPCKEPIPAHASLCNSGSILLGHGALIIVLTIPPHTYQSSLRKDVLPLHSNGTDSHTREVVVFTDLMDAITAFRLWKCGGGTEAFYQLEMLGGSHSALFNIREAPKSTVDGNWWRRAEALIGAPLETCFHETTDFVHSTFAWDKIRDAALRQSYSALNSVSQRGDKWSQHDCSSAVCCPTPLHENKRNDNDSGRIDHVLKCALYNALNSYISIIYEEQNARSNIIHLRFSQLIGAAMSAHANDAGDIASMSMSLRNGATPLENSIAQDVISLLAEEEATARMKLNKFLCARSSASYGASGYI